MLGRSRSTKILLLGMVAALPIFAILTAGSAWLGVRTAVGKRVASLLASPSAAQGTLDFQEVPEESVTALERRRARRARAPSAPGVQPPPTEPSAPEVPPAPTPARLGDLVKLGADIHIEEGEVVEGDVHGFGGDVRVDGHVRGDVSATGGDVTLGPTARVDGDVVCIGGQLVEETGASVGGQRVTMLQGRKGRRLTDRVAERIRQGAEGRVGERWDPPNRSHHLFAAIMLALVLVGMAWLVSTLAPGRSSTALDTLKREPGMSFLLGFLSFLLIAPSFVAYALVIGLLCITIIGIPLAIGVAVGYPVLLVVAVAWGLVVGGSWLGVLISPRFGPPSPTFSRASLGGAIFIGSAWVFSEILGHIPMLGWLGGLIRALAWVTVSLIGIMGVGALIRSKAGRGREGQWWPRSKRPAAAIPQSPVPPPPAPESQPPSGGSATQPIG